MKIDTGLAAVIVAVLVFYLRLIVIQREAARRARLEAQKAATKASKKGKKSGAPVARTSASRSILSKNKLDLAIAGVGLLAIVVGALANAGVIGLPVLQTYWWAPLSLGIVAFSWAFKLPK